MSWVILNNLQLYLELSWVVLEYLYKDFLGVGYGVASFQYCIDGAQSGQDVNGFFNTQAHLFICLFSYNWNDNGLFSFNFPCHVSMKISQGASPVQMRTWQEEVD